MTTNNLSNKEFTIKDSGERTTFDTGCQRDIQAGKGRFDLIGSQGMIRVILLMQAHSIPFVNLGQEGLFRLAKWYEMGADKYKDRNWEKGMYTGNCFNSGVRHLTKYVAGWKDEDHLAAFVWNMFAIMEYETTHPEMQNLPRRLDNKDWSAEARAVWLAGDDKPLIKDMIRISPDNMVSEDCEYAYAATSLYMAGWRNLDYLAMAAFYGFRIMEKEKNFPEFQNLLRRQSEIDYAE